MRNNLPPPDVRGVSAPRTPAVVADEQAADPAVRYVTTQELSPLLVGMLRGLYLGVFGAASGLLVGLQMGSRDWPDLLWGMLIGFLTGFLGRSAEAVIMDSPKASSKTERVN